MLENFNSVKREILNISEALGQQNEVATGVTESITSLRELYPSK